MSSLAEYPSSLDFCKNNFQWRSERYTLILLFFCVVYTQRRISISISIRAFIGWSGNGGSSISFMMVLRGSGRRGCILWLGNIPGSNGTGFGCNWSCCLVRRALYTFECSPGDRKGSHGVERRSVAGLLCWQTTVVESYNELGIKPSRP